MRCTQFVSSWVPNNRSCCRWLSLALRLALRLQLFNIYCACFIFPRTLISSILNWSSSLPYVVSFTHESILLLLRLIVNILLARFNLIRSFVSCSRPTLKSLMLRFLAQLVIYLDVLLRVKFLIARNLHLLMRLPTPGFLNE